MPWCISYNGTRHKLNGLLKSTPLTCPLFQIASKTSNQISREFLNSPKYNYKKLFSPLFLFLSVQFSIILKLETEPRTIIILNKHRRLDFLRLLFFFFFLQNNFPNLFFDQIDKAINISRSKFNFRFSFINNFFLTFSLLIKSITLYKQIYQNLRMIDPSIIPRQREKERGGGGGGVRLDWFGGGAGR